MVANLLFPISGKKAKKALEPSKIQPKALESGIAEIVVQKQAVIPDDKLALLHRWASTSAPETQEHQEEEVATPNSPSIPPKKIEIEGKLKEDRLETVERIIKAYEYDSAILDLSSLGLTDLPEILEDERFQSHLTVLNLSGNQLKEIPAPILHLKELETLIVRNNQLQEIPAGIANLTKLKCFIFWGNKLSPAIAQHVFDTVKERSA